jgi:hypothetical protein
MLDALSAMVLLLFAADEAALLELQNHVAAGTATE